MKAISVLRFDALAGYARQPSARLAGEEIGWYEQSNGAAVGLLLRDLTDGDVFGIVFARDEKLRFRYVRSTPFQTKRRRAELDLRRALEVAAMAPPEAHHQGDVRGPPVDFFALSRPRPDINPDFLTLAEAPGYVSARGVIEPMMRWFEDADGNFIEQFQTTGFDQRIWELYLFAAFTEMGYVLDRKRAVPDYNLKGLFAEVAVEAVTVGPTQGGQLDPMPDLGTEAGQRDYLLEYMPIKFGSPLFSKLKKRYWEKPHIAGKPLVFAIEDFSSPGSMVVTASALEVYLYGYLHEGKHDDAGKLIITPKKINQHRWGKKVIPSGFFDQPDTEHVSAVLFSNSGTIAKFNRMGIVAGFSDPNVVVIRKGQAINHASNDAEPVSFCHVVNGPDYREVWVEGLSVFHNPRALHPLDPVAMPGAAHHFLRPGGQRVSEIPTWMPLASTTEILAGMNVEAFLEALQHNSLD